jgi:hypothetical protein
MLAHLSAVVAPRLYPFPVLCESVSGPNCTVCAKVAVFQAGMDPALLGCSILEQEPAKFVPLLAVAMENDRHFWGTAPIELQVPPQPDNGDWIPVPGDGGDAACKRKRPQCADESDEESVSFAELPRTRIKTPDDATVEAELALCSVLLRWSPWAAPAPDLVEAMQALSAVRGNAPQGQRCLLRQHAVQDLVYEEVRLLSPDNA